MTVKTRFAPSPTGNLHIGSIRTALYSWLFARKHNGKFILRIEDTDFKRSDRVSIDTILNGLKWLGLNWDEGPYFQSKRLHRYKEVIKMMLEEGSAYVCVCSPETLDNIRNNQIIKGCKPRYLGTCRNLKLKNLSNTNYVIRFKNPLSGKVRFQDEIRGEIIFNNEELDDLIIQRSNGMPTYNFCVVIDDLDMKITHVIRGSDHINNTPRQINILHALGAKIPIYAHLSMILDEKGCKISKRKNAVSIMEYYKNGFLAEAVLNYVVRLGWSYHNQEIFSVLEMKKLFNLESISRSSSMTNFKKLLWINKHYINFLPLEYTSNILRNYIKNYNIKIDKMPDLQFLVKLLKNRCYTFKEMIESHSYFYKDFNFFNEEASKKYLILQNYFILEQFHQKIKKLSIWDYDKITKIIHDLVLDTKEKMKEVSMVLRVAITGNTFSPSISSVIFLIGRDTILLRIKRAIDYIKEKTS